SPDGRGVLYGGWGGGYRFCDPVTGKARWENLYVAVEASTFSSDGTTLLWVSGHLVYSDAATGEKRKTALLNNPYPRNRLAAVLALAPDGRLLALGTQTGHVYFCDPLTGAELKRFHAADRPAKGAPERGYLRTKDGIREGVVNRVAFSPNSKWLATGGSEGDVRLWEVATGREVLRLKGHK